MSRRHYSWRVIYKLVNTMLSQAKLDLNSMTVFRTLYGAVECAVDEHGWDALRFASAGGYYRTAERVVVSKLSIDAVAIWRQYPTDINC